MDLDVLYDAARNEFIATTALVPLGDTDPSPRYLGGGACCHWLGCVAATEAEAITGLRDLVQARGFQPEQMRQPNRGRRSP